jgi:hypothetical protein
VEASVWIYGLEYHADGTLSDPKATASFQRTEKVAVCKEKAPPGKPLGVEEPRTGHTIRL